MGIPVAELQERVSSHDFAEYWVYFNLEPWGIEREDLRAGIVASTIANANRDPKKKAQPFTPDQFMPKPADFDADDDQVDEDEAIDAAARIDALMSEIGAEPQSETILRRRQ